MVRASEQQQSAESLLSCHTQARALLLPTAAAVGQQQQQGEAVLAAAVAGGHLLLPVLLGLVAMSGGYCHMLVLMNLGRLLDTNYLLYLLFLYLK